MKASALMVRRFELRRGPALTEPAAGPVNRGETQSGISAAYQAGPSLNSERREMTRLPWKRYRRH